jgi:5'-phosphate synthase pdxT subunit
LNIGVLALQGAFFEHIEKLRALGVSAVEVRLPPDLENLDGLILPGGESTTIGKLAAAFGLLQPIREFGSVKPVWGTCAGAILLARNAHRDQPLLGMMDIAIRRNAFGRQVESFTVPLDIPALSPEETGAPVPFPGVFIRAPVIESAGEGVDVLGRLTTNEIVAARQGSLIATCFHPELAADNRFHEWFAGLCRRTTSHRQPGKQNNWIGGGRFEKGATADEPTGLSGANGKEFGFG